MHRIKYRTITSKVACALFTMIMIFSFSGLALANSGPVFRQGYPSSDVLTVDKNSPIAVQSENLVFDFSDPDCSSYTLNARISATYEMANPTDIARVVPMAFPLVGTLSDPFVQDIVITAGAEVLPYTLYAGDTAGTGSPWQAGEKVIPDFAAIVGAISDESYRAANFTQNELGKRYIITAQPSSAGRINLAVDFTFDPARTKVLTKGFNRYEHEGTSTRVAAWCYEPKKFEIFVLGADIEMQVTAYTDGELKQKTDSFTHEITSSEADLRQYLTAYIEKNTRIRNAAVLLQTNQLYNLYAEALDKALSQNLGYASVDELIQVENITRLLTLVYTVEFPAFSTQEVRVSYRTAGTMDRTKTNQPLYTFDYILNPAEHWRDFKNLDIRIITPTEAPYVISSTIELTKEQDNNVYTASLDTLPQHDFSFTLYAKERVSIADKISGYLNRRFGYFTPVLAGGLLLLLIGFIIARMIIRR